MLLPCTGVVVPLTKPLVASSTRTRVKDPSDRQSPQKRNWRGGQLYTAQAGLRAIRYEVHVLKFRLVTQPPDQLDTRLSYQPVRIKQEVWAPLRRRVYNYHTTSNHNMTVGLGPVRLGTLRVPKPPVNTHPTRSAGAVKTWRRTALARDWAVSGLIRGGFNTPSTAGSEGAFHL